MPEEKKDQAQPEQSKSLSELFDEGWNKYDEEMKVAKEATVKKEEPKPGQKTFKRKPCPECPEEDAVPYRVLKVDGQEIPIWTEDELIAKAQMGDSYTRKTQKLADERRSAENEYKGKVSEIEQFLKNFNTMFGEKIKGNQGPEEQEVQPKEKIYSEFEIEEDFAEPYQKKLVDNIMELRSKIKTQEDTIKELNEFVKFTKIERGMTKLATHINAAREKFPIEVYKDDEGNNLTAKQLVEIIDSKAKMPENKNRDLGEIAEEAVKDIHLMQKRIQESAPVTNNMTAAELKTKYPKLYEDIVKDASQAAVARHEAEKSELPPSIPKKEGNIDIDELKKAKRDSSGKSLSEQLEDAFNDPEILGALGVEK